MERRFRFAGVALLLFALIAAAPASANAPRGKGLEQLGEFQCEGLGTVTLVGPGGGPVAFTTTGLHLIAKSLSATFTDPDGNIVDSFTQSFGNKTGLGETFTCVFTEVVPGEGTLTIFAEAVIVPPSR